MCNRYQEFRYLRREIRNTFPHLANLAFPQKHWFFNLSDKILKQRQSTLEDYLNKLVALDPQPLELGKKLEFLYLCVSAIILAILSLYCKYHDVLILIRVFPTS